MKAAQQMAIELAALMREAGSVQAYARELARHAACTDEFCLNGTAPGEARVHPGPCKSARKAIKAAKPGRGGQRKTLASMTPTERGKRVGEVIGKARNTLSTDITHTTADGAWTPERAAMHREIVDALYARAANVPRNRQAVIAGGLGGAGKSTVLRRHAGINPDEFLTLNPDDIKEEMARRGMIPEVPDEPGMSPMERSALVHEESSIITKMLADRAYRDGTNVIWDITMSSGGGVRSRLDDMDSHGYNVDGVFVDIPVEVSVQRAMARYARGVENFNDGEGLGGRYVPPEIIRAQRSSSGETINREVFDGMRDRFANWSVYDNSVTGRAPELVGRSTGGGEAR